MRSKDGNRGGPDGEPGAVEGAFGVGDAVGRGALDELVEVSGTRIPLRVTSAFGGTDDVAFMG